MMTWLKFDKLEGNNCNSCGQTGINQWFDQDGMTIYFWQKPNTSPCKKCQLDKYELYRAGQRVDVNGWGMYK